MKIQLWKGAKIDSPGLSNCYLDSQTIKTSETDTLAFKNSLEGIAKMPLFSYQTKPFLSSWVIGIAIKK